MANYYYFATQLPMLIFGQETFMTSQKFLEEAQKWFSSREKEIISAVNIDNFNDNKAVSSFQKEYSRFEYQLRLELSEIRQKVSTSNKTPLAPVIKNIVSEGNPLEIETKLLKFRWEYIEEKEVGHFFDLVFFECYLLKLQILERLIGFNKEEGKKTFSTLCEVQYG